jgi:hypothetical protein
MRLSVRRVLEALAQYPDRAELLREYPELDEEDVQQALSFAAAGLDDCLVDMDSRCDSSSTGACRVQRSKCCKHVGWPPNTLANWESAPLPPPVSPSA